MSPQPESGARRFGDLATWKEALQRFRQSSAWRASWQLVNSVGSYAAVWCGMWFALQLSWWLALPMAVLAGGLLVRVFILFHDCGHGSFFASRRANDVTGIVTGLLAFTSYYHWRGEHAIHHGTNGDLSRRGIGDIWTMTVQEYLASSRGRRIGYRIVRHPLVLFGVAPLLMFLWRERWARKDAPRRDRVWMWITNGLLLAMAYGMSLLFGFWPYVVLQLVVLLVAGSVGVWLFYLQHQFEDAYWERGPDWDYVAAALQGSSFFHLPKVLQWFSGNIGFHHIHHLDAKIPNYRLQRCHESDPRFLLVKPMTLASSLKSLGLRLWDESSKKLVSFRELRRQLAGKRSARA